MGEVPPPVPSPAPPGLAWLEIPQHPTPEAFASAFTQDAGLEASVLREPAESVAVVWKVCNATHGVYEQLAFMHETSSDSRTYLEWEGRFEGRDVAGVTILVRDARGLIESGRLHHRPLNLPAAWQRGWADEPVPSTAPAAARTAVLAFSWDLRHRRGRLHDCALAAGSRGRPLGRDRDSRATGRSARPDLRREFANSDEATGAST